MSKVAWISLGTMVLVVVGCGSKPDDDGLKLDAKTKPPIDQPATDAVAPDVAAGKKGEGEAK